MGALYFDVDEVDGDYCYSVDDIANMTVIGRLMLIVISMNIVYVQFCEQVWVHLRC